MKAPHPEYPSTWVPYKKTNCFECQAGCCTTLIEADEADLVRMEVLTIQDLEILSLKEIIAHLKLQGIIQRYDQGSQKFILAQKSGKDCLYLDSNRHCTIYEKRPKTCREFPLKSSRPGFCPYKKKQDCTK